MMEYISKQLRLVGCMVIAYCFQPDLQWELEEKKEQEKTLKLKI